MVQSEGKVKVVSSLFWILLEKGGSQGIQFIIQIIIARLLLPEDFGLIALVSIFILLANVIVQSGFNTALIQKKHVDKLDFSSAFYMTLGLASLIYIILFFSSPFIAGFFSMPGLSQVLRVLGLTLFFGVFNSIQNAVIAKEMAFKLLFISTSGAMVISGMISVIMAFKGFGVWALVMQQLLSQCLTTIILWNVVKWRPGLLFSFDRIRILFSFGWKVLISSLMDTLFDNLRSLIIGKLYSPLTLGYYNRGKQFPSLIVTNISGSIQTVMLPTLSLHQENIKKVKSMIRRSIVTSSFLIFPMMIGLVVTAEPLVRLLLTEKWLPAVPYLQIFSFSYALRPVQTANLQAIIALGRSDISLKLQILKNVFGLVALLIAINYGVHAIAISGLIATIFAVIINMYPNRKLLDYTYKEQIFDIAPSLVISLLMGGVVYIVKYLNVANSFVFVLQVFIGIFTYLILARLMKIEAYKYLKTTILQMVTNQK